MNQDLQALNRIQNAMKQAGYRQIVVDPNGNVLQNNGAPDGNLVTGQPFRFIYTMTDAALTSIDLRTATAYSLDANLTAFMGAVNSPQWYLSIDRVLNQVQMPSVSVNATADAVLTRQAIDTYDLEIGKAGNLNRYPVAPFTTLKYGRALTVAPDSDQAAADVLYELNAAGDPVGPAILQPGPVIVDLSSDLFQLTPRANINFNTAPSGTLWVWGVAVPRNIAEAAGLGVAKNSTCPPSAQVADDLARRVAQVPPMVRTLG